MNLRADESMRLPHERVDMIHPESFGRVNPTRRDHLLVLTRLVPGQQAIPGIGVLQEGGPDEYSQWGHTHCNVRSHERRGRMVHHASGASNYMQDSRENVTTCYHRVRSTQRTDKLVKSPVCVGVVVLTERECRF